MRCPFPLSRTTQKAHTIRSTTALTRAYPSYMTTVLFGLIAVGALIVVPAIVSAETGKSDSQE